MQQQLDLANAKALQAEDARTRAEAKLAEEQASTSQWVMVTSCPVAALFACSSSSSSGSLSYCYCQCCKKGFVGLWRQNSTLLKSQATTCPYVSSCLLQYTLQPQAAGISSGTADVLLLAGNVIMWRRSLLLVTDSWHSIKRQQMHSSSSCPPFNIALLAQAEAQFC